MLQLAVSLGHGTQRAARYVSASPSSPRNRLHSVTIQPGGTTVCGLTETGGLSAELTRRRRATSASSRKACRRGEDIRAERLLLLLGAAFEVTVQPQGGVELAQGEDVRLHRAERSRGESRDESMSGGSTRSR